MGQRPDNVVKLSETLSLAEYKSGGMAGFWLYDKTRGMNLAMRAKSDTDAFVKALGYYQRQLQSVENKHRELDSKVSEFVEQFVEDDDTGHF